MSEYTSLVLTKEEAETLQKYLKKRPRTVSATDNHQERNLQSIERKLTDGANAATEE